MNSHVSLDALNILTLSPSLSLVCYFASLFLSHLFDFARCRVREDSFK